jgi:hypothetical protein
MPMHRLTNWHAGAADLVRMTTTSVGMPSTQTAVGAVTACDAGPAAADMRRPANATDSVSNFQLMQRRTQMAGGATAARTASGSPLTGAACGTGGTGPCAHRRRPGCLQWLHLRKPPGFVKLTINLSHPAPKIAAAQQVLLYQHPAAVLLGLVDPRLRWVEASGKPEVQRLPANVPDRL